MISFSHAFSGAHDCTQCEVDGVYSGIVEERDSGGVGYYDLPFDRRALENATSYVSRRGGFLSSLTHMVVIGVGGSSLGLKAIDTMLYHLPCRKGISLKFLEHTDPVKIRKQLRKIVPQSTLFVVISKSGTTIETISLMKYVFDRYSLLDHKENLLVITDADSPLHVWSLDNGVDVFTIRSNIGGRFCVLSEMGLIPLKILGYDVGDLLDGARAIASSFFSRQEEHILKKAIFMAKNQNKYGINILFSYSSSFEDFNLWYIQLWGESLGKINSDGERIGLTPIGLIGSIDQHSFLQLILQGQADKSITFLRLHRNDCNDLVIPDVRLHGLGSTDFINGVSFAKLLNMQQMSTMETVLDHNIPTDLIELDVLNEANVGSLVYYYELLTSIVGKILGVNTYDQPAVELGKSKLRQMVERLPLNCDQPASP